MESLLLFRRALSSPTMCRFIPALSVPLMPVPLMPEHRQALGFRASKVVCSVHSELQCSFPRVIWASRYVDKSQ